MKPAAGIIAFILCLPSVPSVAQTAAEDPAIVLADKGVLMNAIATVQADVELLKADQMVGYPDAIQADTDRLAIDRQVLREAKQKLLEDKKALHIEEKDFDVDDDGNYKEFGHTPLFQ
jgi:hypothetical protein